MLSVLVVYIAHSFFLFLVTFFLQGGAQGTLEGNFKIQSLRKKNIKPVCLNLIAGEAQLPGFPDCLDHMRWALPVRYTQCASSNVYGSGKHTT